MRAITICIVRIYPIILNVFIVLLCIEGFIGVDVISSHLYTFIGQSYLTIALLWALSKQLKFCSWHRILLINMFINLSIETITNFGLVLKYELYICTVITTILIALSFCAYGRKKTKRACKCAP